jgi:protein-S-isoprenylcysteine O-methyltransferase Ste14
MPLAFAIALTALYLEAGVEERWMESQFGELYGDYRKRSWALLPAVF